MGKTMLFLALRCFFFSTLGDDGLRCLLDAFFCRVVASSMSISTSLSASFTPLWLFSVWALSAAVGSYRQHGDSGGSTTIQTLTYRSAQPPSPIWAA